MKKITAMLITAMLLNLCSVFAMAEESYSATPSEWAQTEISKARVTKITFDSILRDYDKDINREEFCRLIINVYRALGGKDTVGNTPRRFSDTSMWDISLAYTLGIVNGITETEFAPYEKITREQMAVMMNNLIELNGYSASPGDLSAFEDYNQISSWAEKSMSILLGAGIIKGISDTQLGPRGNASREQAIVAAWRLYLLLGQKDALLYEETSPEIMTELGIISKEDWNKGGYISTLEALVAIERARGYDSTDTTYAGQWRVEELAAWLEPLDDGAKSLLFSLCFRGRNPVLTTDEVLGLDLSSNITNYDALLYVIRMAGDTDGCTDSVLNRHYTEESVYETAYEKGLITSTDTGEAHKPITREEFYNILHKALFVEFYSGGAGGVYIYRLISNFENI